jgi:membrane-bound lytic murein transglycosylase F
LVAAGPAEAQRARPTDSERYDEAFRKYSKRYFGPAFDWRIFKAQGMAESNLEAQARSKVGARGVMQLMPSTFREIRSQQPELRSIDHPEMNIAAGIHYGRMLWTLWEADSIQDESDRKQFMFGSYNAGRRTILNAQVIAREEQLDDREWEHIARVAPKVRRWRFAETLGYVARIDEHLATLDADGRARARPRGPASRAK